MNSPKSASRRPKPFGRSKIEIAQNGVARSRVAHVWGLPSESKRKSRRPQIARSALPLFGNWPIIARRIRKAAQILLFLDFDGTLVGFRKDPKQVRLDDSTRQLLDRLALNARVKLGFISGRRRADVKRRVRVAHARYWGLHGWEDRPGKRLGRGTRRSLLRAYRELSQATAGLPSVWVQDKFASIVLHYRGAPADAAGRAVAAGLRIGAGPQLRILKGKKILEIMASEVQGKGAAVAEALRAEPAQALPIYIGDDKTDEPAFAALNGRGLTIRSGRGAATSAEYRLKDPGEVKEFLERLEREL